MNKMHAMNDAINKTSVSYTSGSDLDKEINII